MERRDPRSGCKTNAKLVLAHYYTRDYPPPTKKNVFVTNS
jgi:hypothetical protein